MVSASVVVVGSTGKLGSEKPSSERPVLSRREAAVARRLPVWRRTMASSNRPR